MLGDGHIKQTKGTNENPLYTQTFGQNSELFAKYVFDTYKEFCTPKGFYSYKVQSGKNSPFYQRYIVRTRSLSIFTEFFNIYYIINSEGKRIKILPLEIEFMLTPIVLANLIMSDGNFHKQHHIIRICTNNYTKQEVQLLSTAIYNKYGIESRIEHVRNEQYILVIRKTQISILQNLVKAHIIPSMQYRIGL